MQDKSLEISSSTSVVLNLQISCLVIRDSDKCTNMQKAPIVITRNQLQNPKDICRLLLIKYVKVDYVKLVIRPEVHLSIYYSYR